MASLQAHDAITAPVTAPADAQTKEQLPYEPKEAHQFDEKREPSITAEDEKDFDEDEGEVLNNLFPFPPLKGVPEEEQQLSIRALVIGICLGAVVSASNIYLGLKTGWTFGASLFGGILGFAIIKPLSRIAPKYLGGGYFGPKVCVCIGMMPLTYADKNLCRKMSLCRPLLQRLVVWESSSLVLCQLCTN